MKIHYLIIEKDKKTRNDLRQMLNMYPDLQCDGECGELIDAINYREKNHVDLVFMNYEMGDPAVSGDAFYTCNYWKDCFPDMMTILYGADTQQAYLAACVGSVNFFRTPVEMTEIQRVVSRIREQFEVLKFKKIAQNRLIMIRTKNGYKMIERSKILFVERFDRKNRLITSEGNEIWLSNYSMDELESLLEPFGFFRCYQSIIVNLEKVTSVTGNSEKKYYTLGFAEYDGEIQLSRNKYVEILELLKEQYSSVYL